MNPVQRDADVLIVGAGPVGLTLANDLAARGVSFRIIDTLPEATRNSRAHGLQSRTLEALDTLGLAEAILAGAQHPQPPMLILSGKKVAARLDFARFPHEPYPYQLLIWQQNIERILQTALGKRGHFVERSTRLATFEMDTDGVTAHIDRENGDQDTIRAGWIVGCDGGHSTIHETLGLKMEGTTIPGQFLIGEFDLNWKRSRDTAYEWWHRDGVAVAIYIDFTKKWHVFIQRDQTQTQPPDLEQMRALFCERTGDSDIQLSNPAWMGALIINQRMPNRFIVERAIIAGDAAHVHSPAGGQGMNTGMQDALNLGWKLALAVSGAASSTLLQTYESERLLNARKVLRSSLKYQRFMFPRGAFERLVTGAFFRAVMAIRPFGETVARTVGMLDVNYADSSLSRHDSSETASRTRAGWHVPDVACRRNGRATGLFEILRGTRANLLLFAGATPTIETVAALRTIKQAVAPFESSLCVHYVFTSELDADAAGINDASVITDGGQYLETAFGMTKPEIIYVRPDGYIGLRTQNLNRSTLIEYLNLIYAMRQAAGQPRCSDQVGESKYSDSPASTISSR
jgi:2-polyprenyl-6-methoxyphenol hydroxylase-like FAD-dependent oxidoreductase